MASTNLANLRVSRDGRGVVTAALNVPGRTYNVLNEEVIGELETLLDALEHDPAARLLLLQSDKPSGFLAGGDLRAVYAIESRQTAERMAALGQRLFDRLERLPMPTVAAIHGPCLGGGLEFALACRYRIAQDDDHTRFGLPEVELGLLPCWGGPQRLREVTGLSVALQMILHGKQLSAREAVEIGLIDAVWSQPRFADGAAEFICERLEGKPLRRRQPGGLARFRDRTRLGQWALLRAAHRQIARRTRHDPASSQALWAAFAAIQQGIRRGRVEGLRQEREVFPELLFSPRCRSRLEQFLDHRTRKAKATS